MGIESGHAEMQLRGTQIGYINWTVCSDGPRLAEFRLDMKDDAGAIWLVDSFANGWLKTVDDIKALRIEVNTLIDCLVDFDVELRKLVPQQLELFSEEDRAL